MTYRPGFDILNQGSAALEPYRSTQGRDRMLRKFFGYFGGMIVHSGATLDELARESSIRFHILAKDAWTVVLGTLAIHRVQKIPVWSAVMIMLFGYVLWYYGVTGTYVR